ncbi:DUF748 domain-containing protein [Muricauda sp. TY007]|uniref:DUF748 domain-containing protein n=1 Tax=Allomuricauda sp. TY007 TaxID=2683200 RepID=UPI0013C0A2B4|nr:DUF748 domain-containing protein [Muricauda sp. TY007]NDV16832.1 DUF748 domain-containing protein [Muricauda sp. TY007]
MPQSKVSRYVIIAVGIILVLILATVAAQIMFTTKVETALQEKVPASLNFTYDNLSTNVLLGRISLSNVSAKNQNIDFKAKSATVSGLSYIPLLQNGDITINELHLEAPEIIYHQTEKDTTSKKDNKTPSQTYTIKSFSIQDGLFKMLNTTSDSTAAVEGIDFTLFDITFNEETSTQNIPFTYGEYQLHAKKGYYDLGPLEFIEFQQMQLNPIDGQFQQLVLRSKYSKAKLSKRLALEHDHYDLTIDNLILKDWDFGMENELPYFHLGHIQVQEPIFHVYRDKLLPDDTTHKKLYNQALRDLQVDLQVDSIQISKGLVTYKERLEADIDPKNLSFTDIEATIYNLHTKGEGDVTVDINAKLMGNGPFTLDWSFDPLSKSNDFLAKGSLSNFQSESISPFLKSNLNAEVKGTIQQLFFTISGNELDSQGDMKMKYDDFEFTVLKKDGFGVNKILTAVVNLFTKNGEKTDEDGFRHGNFKVERNQDKSFFNYLWINLKEGLVDTMTGRGKKRK